MKNQKNIRTFIISTKGIFGSKRILEHVKNNIGKKKIDENDADKIVNEVKSQIKDEN